MRNEEGVDSKCVDGEAHERERTDAQRQAPIDSSVREDNLFYHAWLADESLLSESLYMLWHDICY